MSGTATIGEALQDFWSGFDLPAYHVNSVPDDAVMPYLTYDVIVADFESDVTLNINLWYRTESEAVPNAKAEEIGEALDALLPVKGGYIWLKKGTPFWQAISDEDNSTTEDNSIKRRYINVTAEYLR